MHLARVWLLGVAGLGAAVALPPQTPPPTTVAAQPGDLPDRHERATTSRAIAAGVVGGLTTGTPWAAALAEDTLPGDASAGAALSGDTLPGDASAEEALPEDAPPEDASTEDAPSEDAPPEGRRFTIAAAGDVLVHMPVTTQARAYGATTGTDFDYAPMFDEVRPALAAADLSICHLEVPLSPDNAHLAGFPLFSAPHQLAEGLAAASFDTCSTASNHSVDQGGDGVTSTLDALDAAGVAHAGTARTAEEAEQPRLHEVAGVTVGHIAATYGLNGLPLPPGEPWRVDLLHAEHLLARATAAREAGAEFVVASLHWGQEYRREPTAEQRSVAHTLLAEGAVDLIVGHHAHVVQPIGEVDGRPVAFGLGNFLSNQSAACCPAATQDGVIVRFEVAEEEPGEFVVARTAAVPTWVDRSTYTVVDVLAGLAAPETPPDRRGALEQSLARTMQALAAEGAVVDPVPAAPADLPAPGDPPPPRSMME